MNGPPSIRFLVHFVNVRASKREYYKYNQKTVTIARTAANCTKSTKAHAKRAKIPFFIEISKFVSFSSLWLLKLPVTTVYNTPRAWLSKTPLFHHQTYLSTHNPVQNYISEFPREICESKHARGPYTTFIMADSAERMVTITSERGQ